MELVRGFKPLTAAEKVFCGNDLRLYRQDSVPAYLLREEQVREKQTEEEWFKLKPNSDGSGKHPRDQSRSIELARKIELAKLYLAVGGSRGAFLKGLPDDHALVCTGHGRKLKDRGLMRLRRGLELLSRS